MLFKSEVVPDATAMDGVRAGVLEHHLCTDEVSTLPAGQAVRALHRPQATEVPVRRRDEECQAAAMGDHAGGI